MSLENATELILSQHFWSSQLADESRLIHEGDQGVMSERVLDDFGPAIVEVLEEVNQLNRIEGSPQML